MPVAKKEATTKEAQPVVMVLATVATKMVITTALCPSVVKVKVVVMRNCT
jgi:hypothetical protein